MASLDIRQGRRIRKLTQIELRVVFPGIEEDKYPSSRRPTVSGGTSMAVWVTFGSQVIYLRFRTILQPQSVQHSLCFIIVICTYCDLQLIGGPTRGR